MRVLVVGTVPPPGGAAARALALVAAARVADGDDVEVLSPNPVSAAHRSARLSGLWLAAQLVRAAPRHDAVVLRVEPDLPFHERDSRSVRAAVFLALGLALRLYRDVTLRLDSPVPVPGGLGGRPTVMMWRHATRIVVTDEADRAMLAVVPGVDLARVVLEDRPVDPVPPTGRWPLPTETDLRDAALREVKRRAARDRAIERGRVGVGAQTGTAVLAPFADDGGRVRVSLQGVGALAVAKTRRVATRALAAARKA